MIRLRHLSGSLMGTSVSFTAAPIRIGRAVGCELRFDSDDCPGVSAQHAQILLDGGEYVLVDTGSTNGTHVNGQRRTKWVLAVGDQLHFGPPDGPRCSVEEVQAAADSGSDETMATVPIRRPVNLADAVPSFTQELRATAPDTAALDVARAAAEEVAQARAASGGQGSGHTMKIMARAFRTLSETVTLRSRRRWMRIVGLVVGIALLAVGSMGAVIWWQQRRITGLLAEKTGIDRNIQLIQESMQGEEDSVRLTELEQSLVVQVARAESTLARLRRSDTAAAARVSAPGDTLDRDLRAILAKFGASTYAIPPIFRERVQYHIDRMLATGDARVMYARRQQYWPAIKREFAALGLPEEMAYLAWTESNFEPDAASTAGARGMWQMTMTTAQRYGLIVDDSLDERTNVPLQTRAAARHLANLLAEFGEDAFMLALASYNRGEEGVRRALRQVAQEPGGFRREKRDFWHLYRLKKLPEETREYVPKILAAAILGGNPVRYGLAPAPATAARSASP